MKMNKRNVLDLAAQEERFRREREERAAVERASEPWPADALKVLRLAQDITNGGYSRDGFPDVVMVDAVDFEELRRLVLRISNDAAKLLRSKAEAKDAAGDGARQ